MASAISAAFQGTTSLQDENSLKPSRAPPPIPSVLYSRTTAARPPEQGERPIHQANSQQLRSQQISSPLPPQNQQYNSRPSTSTRGRQHINTNQAELQPPPPPQPKKRSNSFSFLRRSSSQQPSARNPQVQQQAVPGAAQPRFTNSSHQAQPSEGSVTSGSTGFLRSLSRDGRGERNMLRKQSKLKQQQQAELERQQRAYEAATRQPPSLPQHNPLPGIDTFGGSDHYAHTDAQAPPALPQNHSANFSRRGMTSAGATDPTAAKRESNASVPATANGEYYEPSGERSTSMTNRGRYSYASSTAHMGSVNSPRRVRRRKDPTPFNVLVIGTKNSGKTSFISFLRNSLALRSERQEPVNPIQTLPKSTFTSQYLETEIDGERVGVTLWDSVGLEENIVDLQLREMTSFIESKFEDTFSEEQKVIRSPGFRDTHIHCVFLVLDPVRLDSTVLAASSAGQTVTGLDQDLDLQVLKALWGKTTVIPVVSKADTLTTNHMTFLKRTVWQGLKSAKLNPLDSLEFDDDDDELDEEEDEEHGEYNGDGYKAKRPNHNRQSSLSSAISDEDPFIPMSILSPDPYSMPPYTKYAPKSQSEIGRRYAWGFASPFNPQHCDFIRLRDTIFNEWRADLRELSSVKWYEQWRTSRLRNAPHGKTRGPNASISQGLPIRNSASRQGMRNFSAGSRVASRTTLINTQAPSAPPASVGMAITTPGGMGQPPY